MKKDTISVKEINDQQKYLEFEDRIGLTNYAQSSQILLNEAEHLNKGFRFSQEYLRYKGAGVILQIRPGFGTQMGDKILEVKSPLYIEKNEAVELLVHAYAIGLQNRTVETKFSAVPEEFIEEFAMKLINLDKTRRSSVLANITFIALRKSKVVRMPESSYMTQTMLSDNVSIIPLNIVRTNVTTELLDKLSSSDEYKRTYKRAMKYKFAFRKAIQSDFQSLESFIEQEELPLLKRDIHTRGFGFYWDQPNSFNYVVEVDGDIKGYVTTFQRENFAADLVGFTSHGNSKKPHLRGISAFMEYELLKTFYKNGVSIVDRGYDISSKLLSFKQKFGAYSEKYFNLSVINF